jgi:hypothetical protein
MVHLSQQGRKQISGQLFPLVERADFNISLSAGASQDLQFMSAPISTLDWASGQLCVVLQAKSWASSTASVLIKAHNVFVDPKSPPNTQYGTSTNPGSVTIANADAAPLFYVSTLSPIGPFLGCDMTFSQGANTGACSFTIGVYLLGRDT